MYSLIVLIIKCSKYSCKQNEAYRNNSKIGNQEDESEAEESSIHKPFKERFQLSIEKELNVLVSGEIFNSELLIKKNSPQGLLGRTKASLGFLNTQKSISSSDTGINLIYQC